MNRCKKNGAAEGTRTPDPIITNDVLYQLSYSGLLLAAAIQGRGGGGKMENVGDANPRACPRLIKFT